MLWVAPYRIVYEVLLITCIGIRTKFEDVVKLGLDEATDLDVAGKGDCMRRHCPAEMGRQLHGRRGRDGVAALQGVGCVLYMPIGIGYGGDGHGGNIVCALYHWWDVHRQSSLYGIRFIS